MGLNSQVQHLDRHVALEPGIAGTIDLAHAACAEQRANLVRADTRAECQCHG
jgi:hypothetical protein